MMKGFGLEDYSPICTGKAKTDRRAKEEGQGKEKTQKRKRGTGKPKVVMRLCRHWPKQDTDFVEQQRMK